MSLFERVVARARPHLVTVIGPGGGRQVAPAARAGPVPARRARRAAGVRARQLPRLRRRARLLGARRDRPRDQFEIVDTDDPTAWASSCAGSSRPGLRAETDEPPERIAARSAPARDRAPGRARSRLGEGEDPQQMRDRLFSAVRSLVEAASRRQPLVFAVEDIHWADEGMLDLIEYLARWVRGPALLLCLARDELLDRRPAGAAAAQRDHDLARPADPGRRRASWSAALLPEGATANGGELVRPGRRALRRQPAVRRGDGQPDPRGGRVETEALPETVHSVLAARLDSLPRRASACSRHASVVGPDLLGGARSSAGERGDRARAALIALQEKDLIVPTPAAGSRASASTPSSTC